TGTPMIADSSSAERSRSSWDGSAGFVCLVVLMNPTLRRPSMGARAGNSDRCNLNFRSRCRGIPDGEDATVPGAEFRGPPPDFRNVGATPARHPTKATPQRRLL